jgi:hypothetical protein
VDCLGLEPTNKRAPAEADALAIWSNQFRLKTSVFIVLGSALALVLAVASTIAGTSAVGSIVLSALSDNYCARGTMRLRTCRARCCRQGSARKTDRRHGNRRSYAVHFAFPFVRCRLIPQRQTHKHGDTQAAEGVVCVEERFKFSPCGRAERIMERIKEAPPAQHGTTPVPRGQPSDGGEAVTMGYCAGLTTAAERHDAPNASAS